MIIDVCVMTEKTTLIHRVGGAREQTSLSHQLDDSVPQTNPLTHAIQSCASAKCWVLLCLEKCRNPSDICQCECTDTPLLPFRLLSHRCLILPPRPPWELGNTLTFLSQAGPVCGPGWQPVVWPGAFVASDAFVWLEFTIVESLPLELLLFLIGGGNCSPEDLVVFL